MQPNNLRLSMAAMGESQWLEHARGMQVCPPMPGFSLPAISDADLRAICRDVKAARNIHPAPPARIGECRLDYQDSWRQVPN